MTTPVRNILSYGETFQKFSTGDVVFLLTGLPFKKERVAQIGLIFKLNGVNMLFLNTVTGFRLKPLKNYSSFLWFPTQSMWTPKADKLVESLLITAASDWRNKWHFWFKESEYNLKILTVAKLMCIPLFNGFPVTLSPTSKHLAAFAENNSHKYFAVYSEYLIFNKKVDRQK